MHFPMTSYSYSATGAFCVAETIKFQHIICPACSHAFEVPMPVYLMHACNVLLCCLHTGNHWSNNEGQSPILLISMLHAECCENKDRTVCLSCTVLTNMVLQSLTLSLHFNSPTFWMFSIGILSTWLINRLMAILGIPHPFYLLTSDHPLWVRFHIIKGPYFMNFALHDPTGAKITCFDSYPTPVEILYMYIPYFWLSSWA